MQRQFGKKLILKGVIMKKIFLIFTTLFLLILTGCFSKSGIGEKDTKNDVKPMPDYEYTENQNGSITITDYLGTDTDIVIPAEIDGKSVTQIGWKAFAYNEDIVSVKIPESVTVIDIDAFSNCTSLSSVLLSPNLESIEDAAFSYCTKLSSISLPPNLNYIGYSVFMNCTELSEIVLPESLTYLGAHAFENCAALKYIKIPSKITEIDWATFIKSGLEVIELGNGIKKIGKEAFAETQLTTVILPKTVTEIGYDAFRDCANLESIVLNEGIVTIEDGALGGQSKLTEITIPASVTVMGEEAFRNCSNLQVVKFQGNAPEDYQTQFKKNVGDVHYTVYYHKEATGFSSPEWCGYTAKIW